MDDRTLLELAAKAAGYDIQWNEKWPCGGSYMIRVVPEPTDPILSKWVPWNSLSENGDALRLAVDLNITFRNFGHVMSAIGSGGQFNEYADGDAYAATRRAITRAAAEIGRAMP
jgi:hypothetical protein